MIQALKKIAWALAHTAFSVLPFILSVLLLTAGGALALALLTTEGARFALDQAEQFSGGALRARGVEGRLMGPLHVDELSYEDRHVRVTLRHLELDAGIGGLLAAQLVVSNLVAQELDLLIKKTAPSAQPRKPFTGLPLPLWLHELSLQHFTLRVEPQARPLEFSAIRFKGRWLSDRLTVESLHANLEPLGALQAQGVLIFLPRALQLEQIHLDGFIQGVADLHIGYDNQIKGQLQWNTLRWPPAGEAQWSGRNGAVALEGRWSDYRYRLHSQFSHPLLAAQLRVSGSGSLQGLNLEQATAELLGGSLQAQGLLHWLPHVELALKGSVQNLSPVSLNAGLPGRINGHYSVQAQALESAPRASFSAQLTDSELRGLPLVLNTRGEWADRALNFSQLELSLRDTRLSVSGQVTPPYRFDAQLDSPNLAGLWPDLAGQVRAGLHAEGERLRIDADGSGLRYQAYSAGRVNLSADLHPREDSRFRLALLRAQAGLPLTSLEFSGAGRAAQHQLNLKLLGQMGEITLGLNGALDLARQHSSPDSRGPSWRGQVTRGQGAPEDLALWTVEAPAALFVSAAVQDLEPLCWSSAAARACVQAHHSANQLRTAFRLTDWNFTNLHKLLPAGWILEGTVSGSGLYARDARGATEARADLRSSAGQLRLGKEALLTFGASRLQVEDSSTGIVALADIPLEGGKLRLDARAAPAPTLADRALTGTLSLGLDALGALRVLSPEIEQASGRIAGEFALTGTLGEPRLLGRASLREGTLQLATPGTRLENLSADVTGAAEGWSLEAQAQTQSSAGPGSLMIKGQRGWSVQAPLTLSITGDNFFAVHTTQTQIWVTPDLQFTWAGQNASLRGQITVPRADIRPRNFEQGQAASSDQVIIRQGKSESALLRLDTEVRVVLGEAVHFEGFGLKTRFSGSLSAYDEPGQPTRGRGEIQLQGGRYRAYGQDLTIETGRLLFNGGSITEPAIELRATRRPREDITVGVSARGPLDAPQFSLFSEPAMPQERQLSWLVLGRALEDASATSGTAGSDSKDRAALSGAALSLGLSGGNLLAQRFTGNLRVDEISIASKPGEAAEQAKLTFGKYLSPKLFVSYGIGLFQPGQTFRLQYDIGHGFKLATETGVESGGDLLYSVER